MKAHRRHSTGAGSHATHTFASVPSASIPRSTFDRNHGYKTTFEEGYLIPILVDEVLPGDTFHLRLTAFARMATPIFPIMDNLYLDTQFWYVPNRLLWNNFQKFMGEQADPDSSTDFILPGTVAPAVTGFTSGSLYDYMGLPIGVADLVVNNALFIRAYNLIYNEWYRDQNMQDSVVVDLDDGPDTSTDYVLLRRGKRHDYFTSALPWPQKINDGSTLNVPLGGTAPIIGLGKATQTFPQAGVAVYETDGTNPTYAFATIIDPAVANSNVYIEGSAAAGGFPRVYADLSLATGVTINELREAFQIQRLFERDARGGTRYTEIIRSHFGVTSPDSRLQRPEYLGGGSTPVNISPIAQTSVTDDQNSPLGSLAAFGTVNVHGNGFSKSFTEHGVIIGLASVRADINYQQGMNRMWNRSTRYDLYWPVLAHLGEQAVLTKEIYCDGSGTDEVVFGYQERYAEYRYKPGLITGLFRSDAAGSLDSWHLAQDFSAAPELDGPFIVEDAPVDRVIAVPSEPHFILDCAFMYKCARPMPIYSVPGLIDHF